MNAMDTFSRMLKLQEQLQTESFGYNFQQMLASERIQYVKDMKLALEAELQEALDETWWKPWTKPRGSWVNREAYFGELVDVLHFWMNMILVLGDDPEELASEIFTRYCLKNHINERRQREGYDGVSTKCGGCGRALDDTAVACRRVGDQGWCASRNADINYIGDGASRDAKAELKPIKPVICEHCRYTINEHGCVPATIERWGHCGADQRQLPPIKPHAIQ